MKNYRKAMQLCHQVADTLNYVFGGDCRDEVLQGLYVLEVTPAPDVTQLLVKVAPLLADERVDRADVLSRLHHFSGRLRAEVAAAITRRKTPRLLFQFVSQPAVSDFRPAPEN